MGAETKGIGQLIQERESIRVPDHQRDYAWPVGVVEQYLLDINAAMQARPTLFHRLSCACRV